MPVKAGQIVIDISAGTSKFVQDMEVAKGKIREFGEAGVSETKATRAAFKAFEGDLFNNTKAAEVFAEKLLGVGNVAKYAFPVIGAAAFGGFVVEAGNKVREFFKGLSEGPEKISNAFRDLNTPIRATNDALQVTNDKLANEIAKLEGKPENNLKLTLDEARKSADDLADSLSKGLDNLNKLLKEQNISNWKALFGQAGTDDIKDDFKQFKDKIDEITDEGAAAVREATDAKSRDAAQTALNTRLLNAYGEQLKKVNGQISEAKSLQQKHDNPSAAFVSQPATSYVPGSLATAIPADQSGRLADLHGGARFLQREMDGIGLRATGVDLTNRKDELSSGAAQRKQAEEALVRLGRELAAAKAAQADAMERINVEERNELEQLQASNQINEKTLNLVHQIYDTKRVTETNHEIEQYSKSVEELSKHFETLAVSARKSFSEMWGTDIKDGVKAMEESAKAATKWAEAQNRSASESKSENVRHGVAMAGIAGNPNDTLGTLRIQQAIELADIQDRYEEKVRLANDDFDRSRAINEKILDLQKLQNEMEERTAAARHKSLQDFMVEMQGAGKTSGDILYDSAHSALDRVSDQFGKLLTGQKTGFREMFRGIGEDMTKEATKSLMQKGLGELGKVLGIKAPAGKPDGTRSNPFHVIVDQSGMPANPLAGLVPSLPPALGGGAAGGLKGALGAIGGAIGKIFGHGAAGTSSSSITFMAGGGDADPGRVYGVAEAGEAELISPKNSSRITPISQLMKGAGGSGGGAVTYNIDARGADLGAENRVARAMEHAHNSAVANGVRASAERAKRTPQRRG